MRLVEMRRARAEAAASGRLDVDAIDPEVKHTAWRTGRDRATTPPSDARWSRLTTRQRPCQARQPMPPRKSRWRCLSNRGSGSALRGSSIGARRAANRRRKADALPAVGGTIANSGTTHGHRTDAGHDLALGQMPMAHQPAVAIIGQLSLHSKRILPEPRHRHPGRLDSAERGEGGDIIEDFLTNSSGHGIGLQPGRRAIALQHSGRCIRQAAILRAAKSYPRSYTRLSIAAVPILAAVLILYRYWT